MPIIFAKAPANAARLLCIDLRDLVLVARIPPGVPVMRLEDLAHTDPHSVFVVGLGDLVEGRLLSAAVQTGWRYLLVQDGAAVAEAELVSKRKAGGKAGEDLQLGALTAGPFTEATIEALNAAERLPSVRKAKYEARFLKIPAVYFAALWLHGGDEDILLPMVDPPGGLKTNRPYSEARVLAALREIAEQNKRFHDSHDAQSKSRGKSRGKGK
ncbi:MAG: hypothetical protein M3Q89_06540 [Verrucomicrobiota bacterium]|nr:hypothetical protein [Verrucomicrobiota bacterium]